MQTFHFLFSLGTSTTLETIFLEYVLPSTISPLQLEEIYPTLLLNRSSFREHVKALFHDMREYPCEFHDMRGSPHTSPN